MTTLTGTPSPLEHVHPKRLAATLGSAALLSLLAVPAADAHVRVLADSTSAGSFSALTFRVPNESDSAATVKVSVELPQDTPLLYVSSKPVPGWRAAVAEAPLPTPVESYGTTLTKAVRTVTWTADRGSAIGPGEYQEFSLSVGPLPEAGTLLLPTTQTYSDDKVVRWDQAPIAGGDEPELPAPALVVTAASASTPAPTTPPSTTQPPTVTTDSSDGVARGLAGGALTVAVAALVAALAGLRRRSGTSS